MKFCFKPRRNVILDLVLILTVFFIGFAAYRTAPKARAGGNAWENSAFGPLDGLEESVYDTAANLANNSFMSVARLQQPILSYAASGGGSCALRMLPMSCDALSGSSALAAAAHSESQDIYKMDGLDEYVLRIGAMGVRPVSANISTYNGVSSDLVFPSDVYMEYLGSSYSYGSDGLSTNPDKILYSYIDESRVKQTKVLSLKTSSFVAYKESKSASSLYFAGLTLNGNPLDCTTTDVDGDGYSDLIVARIGGYNNIYCADVELYDGKALFENKEADACSPKSSIRVFSDSLVFPGYEGYLLSLPCQIRIARGDFDGDGLMEFPLVFSGKDDNKLALIKYNKSSGKLETCMTKELGAGRSISYSQTTEGMDVAVGDFNGDGASEVAVVYGKYSGTVKENPKKDSEKNYLGFKVFKPNVAAKTFGDPVYDYVDTGINLWCAESMTSNICAEAADFDGDGVDELVYTHPGYNDGKHTMYVHVRKWGAGASGGGRVIAKSDTKDMFGWYFTDGDHAGVCAMTTGCFKCTPDNTKQIALASYGNNGIDYAAVELDTSNSAGWSFKTYGFKTDDRSKSAYDGSHISLAAADYDHKTMILGEAEVSTVTARVQPKVEMQGPPKHFDVVDGKKIDVFAQPGSKMNGEGGYYETSVQTTASEAQTSSEVGASSVSWGINITAKLQGGKKDKVGGSGSGGYSFTSKRSQSNTSNDTYLVENKFSSVTTDDDVVVYQTTQLKYYRYPVLYPIDCARGTAIVVSSDEFEPSGDVTEYPTDQFLQIIVPQEPTVYKSDGRDVDWYEPRHQPYNLFSYPRSESEMANAAAKAICYSEGDKVLTIGDGSSSNSTSTLSKVAESIHTESYEDKNSWNVGASGNFGNYNPNSGQGLANLSVNYNHDKTSSNASTSTTNMKDAGTFALNWPGRHTYSGIYTSFDDMAFKTQSVIMVEDCGNLVMAHQIKRLMNNDSAIWKKSDAYGNHGPYGSKGDPALNLPSRYDYNNMVFLEPGSDGSNIRARLLRGLSIYDDSGANGASVELDTITYRAVRADKDYKVKVRVYNYSFVDTNNVTAELHWTEKPTDTLDSSNLVASVDKFLLYGWTNDDDSRMNMKTIEFSWKASKMLSKVKAQSDGVLTGYLHVKLVPGEDEIHADNNWGYVRMALYNPDLESYNTASTASTASLTSAQRDKLFNVELVDTPKIVNASGDEVSRWSSDAKYIVAKVKATSKYAVPAAKVLVIANEKNGVNNLLAGWAFGALHVGDSRIETIKVPLKSNYLSSCKSLTVMVQSPFMETKTKTVEFGSSGSGGSGGCSAGFGILVLLALVPLAAGKAKHSRHE